MKSMKKIVFLFLMATLLPLTTSAEIIQYGSLWYDMHHQPYDDYDAEVIVSQDEPYSGNIIIPQKIFYDGVYCPVTAIGSSAFEGCIGMTSVTIPSSLTTIGDAAFYMCTGLTTVDIPNGVKTIGEGAFSKCGGLTSVTIPSSVTSIGKNAFFQCYGLTQITSWIENPFAIDDGVFPSSVYTNASLLVPSGRKAAYQNTAGWKRFQNIIEPGVVVKEFEVNGIRYLIGENNTVSVISKTEKYTGAVSIPNQVTFNGNNYTVTAIAQSAFEGCVDMTAVTIPSSVTTIGGAAFYYCTGLTTVDIPNGVKTIGEGAFSKCGGLTSVSIPSSVTSIGKNAFFQCYGLTQITSGIENPFAIDDGVFPTSVYTNASLLVPSGRKSAYQNTAGWKRFQNIIEPSVVGKEFEANGVRYLIGENNTVSVISKTEKYAGAVVIPNQVTYSGNNYTVTSIASSAFEGCVDMTSISIPGSVTMIGDAAFYYCTSLTTVDIPNGVKTIGEGAFSKCEGLTSVVIPGSVTSIGKNAFFQCYGLTQITSWIENPFAIDDGVFPTSVYNNASLLVPSGKRSAYQNTAGWKRFQNIYYVDGVYTLTYYVDGVEYKSVTYSSGAGITPEEEPTKEGYTFSGWIDIPETMPDHDVTVTGTFTINQYTITYVIDGEVYATVTVDFNSKIVPLTPPSKDGFDFAWEEYPETMPAHDITINGAYTTTGILSIAVESGKAKIFTLDGRQVDTLQKGINIIRMDDGTIKKVVLGK
jgi:sorbitol-specific phosphotransferase system component IIA